jgi:hypothetical protein
MDIYNRLYRHRTGSASPVEDFLTEALADIFNRLPMAERTELLVRILPKTCSSLLQNKCKAAKQIEAMTQVPIITAGSVKRPDMIVYLDNRKPLVLFEVKINARLPEHQLETYSEWMSSQCSSSGDWPGAVVLLTHKTLAPEGFENDGGKGQSIIRVTRTWKDIGDWLANNLDLKKSETTHCALASDFTRFLERHGLMTDFMTSRDLAVTALFVPAYGALTHTFKTVISAVILKYPKSKSGNVHLDFWPPGNSYSAWYYLNTTVNAVGSKFYIAIGICFPDQGVLEFSEPVGLPKHEPFFFAMFEDNFGQKKASELLSEIPEGWIEAQDENGGYPAVVTRAVSQFEADPDLRAQSLIAWALKEVGRVVACIPNFETASVEEISEEAEEEGEG